MKDINTTSNRRRLTLSTHFSEGFCINKPTRTLSLYFLAFKKSGCFSFGTPKETCSNLVLSLSWSKVWVKSSLAFPDRFKNRRLKPTMSEQGSKHQSILRQFLQTINFFKVVTTQI